MPENKQRAEKCEVCGAEGSTRTRAWECTDHNIATVELCRECWNLEQDLKFHDWCHRIQIANRKTRGPKDV